MAFSDLLQDTITVSRLTADAGNTKTYQVVVASQACMLQPQDEEETVLQGLAVGKAFKCYMDVDANIKESDKVIVNSEEFRVNAIKKYNFGSHQHLKVVLVREEKV